MAIGNKGKFSERLKNILKNKKRKNKTINSDKMIIKDSNQIYTNFTKVVASIPGFVYGNLTSDKKSTSISNKLNDTVSNNKDVYVDKLQNRDRINSINIVDIKKIQDNYFKKSNNSIDFQNSKFDYQSKKANFNDEKVLDINSNIDDKSTDLNNATIKDQNKVKELEKSIINLIKKDLIKIVNEMEILQSELYILSEVNGESIVLKQCQEELDRVKSIICKIDKLKEKYDFLKDNYDFEYLLEIDNNDLVDKIIELKDTFGKNEVKAVAEDYKLLDVYKYLYLKLDDLRDKTTIFEEKKIEEELKLKERDIDFEKLKNDVYNVETNNKSYEYFVNRQNDLLNELNDNVNKISSYEQVDYHLKGFGKLFRNSFKYFGLLMVSPLKGGIPSIATETLITGNLIKNLYKNLEWEESRKMIYEAIDYSDVISNAINDLDNTNRIVDATLEDIVHLKMKYNDKFKKYQGDFLEYSDIMHMINDMENKILGNKIKIEMMRKRALEKKRENEKKLVLVRELNNKENHS